MLTLDSGPTACNILQCNKLVVFISSSRFYRANLQLTEAPSSTAGHMLQAVSDENDLARAQNERHNIVDEMLNS